MPAPRLQQLLERLDALNQQDPNPITYQGKSYPREWLYAQRVSEWVRRLDPSASEAVRIAAHGQHVQRWKIPRDQYPRTRQGYLKWRETLKAMHMDIVQEEMGKLGYAPGEIEHVRRIMSKRLLPSDLESQTLEDALCLAFLETEFPEFKSRTADDKLRDIVRKTWQKMSPKGRAAAAQLPLSEDEKKWLQETLQGA